MEDKLGQNSDPRLVMLSLKKVEFNDNAPCIIIIYHKENSQFTSSGATAYNQDPTELQISG